LGINSSRHIFEIKGIHEETSFIDEPHKKGNIKRRMKRRRLIEVITKELAQCSGSTEDQVREGRRN
jgi:hypothetical protein